MKRNLTKKSAQTQRYSKINPPPNEKIAVERISLLTNDAEKIDAKLRLKTQQEFSEAAQYDSWRVRATVALGYTERELNYLEEWVVTRQQKQQVEEQKKEQTAKDATDNEGWKSVCVTALARAATQGFRLTKKERDVLKNLQKIGNPMSDQPTEETSLPESPVSQSSNIFPTVRRQSNRSRFLANLQRWIERIKTSLYR